MALAIVLVIHTLYAPYHITKFHIRCKPQFIREEYPKRELTGRFKYVNKILILPILSRL
jgi:hypothetical protein